MSSTTLNVSGFVATISWPDDTGADLAGDVSWEARRGREVLGSGTEAFLNRSELAGAIDNAKAAAKAVMDPLSGELFDRHFVF